MFEIQSYRLPLPVDERSPLRDAEWGWPMTEWATREALKRVVKSEGGIC